MSATPPSRRTAKDWDEVRTAFHTSIMIDTSLSSLAQNLDGPDWPLKAKDETPSKYIDFTYEELCAVLGAYSRTHPGLPDLLVSILKDTLAFDNPFGDMVAQSEASVAKENPLFKNLARLAIPEDFPLALTQLSPETREFCALEKLATLGALGRAAQTMSQSVIVGGDFRQLLNAIATGDEEGLAQLLPFRPGTTGLHLPEGLALVVRHLPPETRAAFARRTGMKVAAAELQPSEGLARDALMRRELSARAAADQVLAYFKDQLEELRRHVGGGGSLTRFLMVIGDPAVEAYVAELLAPHLRAGVSPPVASGASSAAAKAPPPPVPAPTPAPPAFGKPPSEPAAKPRRGWLARLFGR